MSEAKEAAFEGTMGGKLSTQDDMDVTNPYVDEDDDGDDEEESSGEEDTQEDADIRAQMEEARE